MIIILINIQLGPLQTCDNIRHLPVSERLLGLRWGGFASEGRQPLNPVQQRLAAGAQRAAGAWGQHGSIDLHLLIEGAEFYGGDGGVVGVEAQSEGHVAEDVLGSEVNAFPFVGYELYVGYGWVLCDREIQIDRLNMSAVILSFWTSIPDCVTFNRVNLKARTLEVSVLFIYSWTMVQYYWFSGISILVKYQYNKQLLWNHSD